MSPAPAQVADLLDKAATYIETHGWTQDEFYDWDHEQVPIDKCKVCARGGIAAAAGAHPEFGECPFDCAELPIVFDDEGLEEEGRLAPEEQEKLDLIRAAEKAFAAHLRNTATDLDRNLPDEAVIARWNDKPERTADQVIAELRACAANLRKAGEA